MAHNKPGTAGEFRGKIGQTVIYRWRELIIGRSTPRKTTKKTTVLQSSQRAEFGSVSSFLNKLKEAIAIGFPSNKGNLSAMNSAIKQNIKHIISDNPMDLKIDYARIQLSKGPLDQVYNPYLSINKENNMILINWQNPANLKLGVEESDTVQLCIYSESANNAVVYKNAAFRIDGNIAIQRNQKEEVPNDTIHGWIFLLSANGKKASVTKYLGKATLL